MDIRKIKKLIELIQDTGVAEIEIKEGEESVRLSRFQSAPRATEVQYVSMPAAPLVPNPMTTGQSAPAPNPTEVISPKGHQLRSPMVGTWYASASPEAAPFVTLGQTINKGDTLGIIEAMKMFNEFEADRAGVITAILVKNGDPVEYNQPLFVIE